MMKNGIDISKYQGNIAWKQVKDSGIDFAIIKAGGSDDGFYTDPTYEANYKNAKAVGMSVGAYYIVGPYCVSKEDGIADAKRFLKMLEGKTFEYPVYIDLELTSPTTKTGTTDAVIAFCKTMEAAGYFCGIYASDISGFKDRLELSRLKTRALWVASYGSMPKYVSSYGIWQKSSTGRVPGIVGDVDLDECYVDYPAIIKSRGDNGFPKPEPPKPQKAKIKATIEIDEHIYSGLLEEQ